MTRVAYIAVERTLLSSEEHAAWKWLSKSRQVKADIIPLKTVSSKPSTLQSYNVVWWHYDSSVDLPEIALSASVKAAFAGFARKGGSILLSLLATPYVVELGFEQTKPNYIRKGPWEYESWVKNYPDIRGLGSLQGHPIFKDLTGAVYTWNPQKGTPYAAAFYQAPEYPRQGRVIAVERQYIKLQEDWRLATEFDAGKGKVLTLGSYLFFSNERDRFRPHLEKLTLNCLEYLSNPGKKGMEKTYWSFESRTVREERHESKPVKAGSQQLSGKHSGLMIAREPEEVADSYFGVGGRRILMMGKEQKGLQEVWCHPFRMLRNVRTGFRIGGGNLQWFDQRKPRVTVRPESVTRTYAVGELRIEETVVGNISQPGGCIHYHINTNHPVELLVTASVDQRLMWPHSEHATGSLFYAWDRGLNAYVVHNDSGRLVSIVGSTLAPSETLAGQLQDVGLREERLQGRTNENVEVALSFRFKLHQPLIDFSIVLAGSDQGEKEALRVYRSLAEQPVSALNEQVRHFRSLFEESTLIDSPDPVFNEGYRWALVGTDRFVVTTPSLGTSLMAGFGTTERGWDGGQKISGRPGYAWYFGRDACWTAFAMLDYGDVRSVRAVLAFLGRHQDLNGKILHELTTSGHVHYDAADSTPLYIILMGRYVRASGDTEFAKKEYPRLLKAIDFCFSTDTNNDHLIENTNVGHGWVEGGKLFPVHTELYLAACWKEALEEGSFVAKTVRKTADAAKWRREAQKVSKNIQKDFWNERTGFYNFGKYADGTYNVERTVLPAVAIYFGCANAENAERCLREYATDDFTADWGARIIGKRNPMFNPQGYHQGSVWPLFTGWASLAEFRAGREVQGYMHAMSTMMGYQHGAAGFIEEVLHGETFKPAGVCSHQAWSESMVLQPLLEGMIGARIDPMNGELTLRPWIPPQWKSASFWNIRCGKSKLHLNMSRSGQAMVFKIKSGQLSPVDVSLHVPQWKGMKIEEMHVSPSGARPGKSGQRRNTAIVRFKLRKSAEITVHYSGGIAVVPPPVQLEQARASTGLRIVKEELKGGRYEVEVEGLSGTEYTLDFVDPGTTVRTVENGILEKREGEIIRVKVPMRSGEGSEYVRTVIALIP